MCQLMPEYVAQFFLHAVFRVVKSWENDYRAQYTHMQGSFCRFAGDKAHIFRPAHGIKHSQIRYARTGKGSGEAAIKDSVGYEIPAKTDNRARKPYVDEII